MFPGVASILVVIRRSEYHKPSEVLLLKSKEGRYTGRWALPGGEYRGACNTCEESAAHLVLLETGFTIHPKEFKLRFIVSDPAREPTQKDIAIIYQVDFRENRSFLNHPQHSQFDSEFLWAPVPQLLLKSNPLVAVGHSSIVRRALIGFSR